MIDWATKMAELKRLAALNLPGRAMDLAVVLLWHANPTHGVAFPGVDDLRAALGNVSDDTLERARAALVSAGAMKLAKRRGAAVQWFPRLMDMSPGEARKRVDGLKAARRAKDDPASLRGHSNDPADLRSVDPAQRPSEVRGLNLPSNDPSLSGRHRRTLFGSKDDFRDAHEELKAHNAADATAPEPQRRLAGGGGGGR